MDNNLSQLRAGTVYFHITRGKPCRVVRVNGDEVQVKFHKDGFQWCAKTRIMRRASDGAVVSMEESREYATVARHELALANRDQVKQYLGTKLLHPKKEPEVGL